MTRNPVEAVAPALVGAEAEAHAEALDAAILLALAPGGLRERLRMRLGGGYTALQVWERVASDAAPAAATDPVEARRAVDGVRRRLEALVAAGTVRRSRSRMTVPLNTKGPRDVVVDLYRLA